MSNTSNLAPDQASSAADLAAAADVFRNITAFAYACESAQLGALTPDPAWLDQVRAAISSSQTAAGGWYQAMPGWIATVVGAYASYASQFAQFAKDITPIPAEGETVIGYLTTLQTALQANASALAQVEQEMGKQYQSFKAQNAKFQSALGDAEEAYATDSAEIAKIKDQIANLQSQVAQYTQNITSTSLSGGKTVLSTSVNIVLPVIQGAAFSFPFVTVVMTVFTIGQLIYSIIVDDQKIQAALDQIRTLLNTLDQDVQAVALAHSVSLLLNSLEDSYDDSTSQLPKLSEVWSGQLTTVSGIINALKTGGTPAKDPDLINVAQAASTWAYLAEVAGGILAGSQSGGRVNLSPVASPSRTSMQLQSASQTGFLSLQVLTAACRGVLNTSITAPSPEPSWYEGLSSQLATAQGHANDWVNTLAYEVTSQIPTAITSFAALAGASGQNIISALDAAIKGDQSQLATASALLQGLVAQLESIEVGFANVSGQLATLAKNLQADHDALDGNVGSIQQAISDDTTALDQLNNDIQTLHESIDSENKILLASEIAAGAGLFIIVAGIGLTVATGGAGAVVLGIGVVTTTVGGAGWGIIEKKIEKQKQQIATDQLDIKAEDQQVATLNALAVSVLGAVTWINNAIGALAQVRSIWGTFAGDMNSVIDDVNDAMKGNGSVEDLSADLLYFQTAQDEWNTLQAFATRLLTTPVTQQQESTSV